MKNYIGVFLLACVLLLGSCSGSDAYQGNWKATDSNGDKFDINFQPKSFTIKSADGKITKFDYTQNSVKIENSIKTYGITLGDGRTLKIFFPNKNETGKASITMPNDEPVYIIGRTAYLGYNDLYKLTE